MKTKIILALTLALAAPAGATMRINGAGATFPYPIYSKWFSEYNKISDATRFNYQSIGSGGGIRQLVKQTVDFGASDAPMKTRDMNKAPWPVLHIPTILGAVAISYRVAGLAGGLKLDGPTLADIFLGKIAHWNHPRIAALNAEVKLPAKNILVVRRSDGSGTTAIFSDYLARVSSEWRDKVGQGKTLRWPVGIGAKGNDGVTAQIKNNDGAIGYIELAYALNNGLHTAAMKNPAGKFLRPNVAGISAAATDAKDPFKGVSIVNAPSPAAYPISAFTYILIPEQKSPSPKLVAVKKFLRWALTEGQQYAPGLHYAPLPANLSKVVLQRLGE